MLIVTYYADNNTLYKWGKNMWKIKNDLKIDFMTLHKWLYENHIVLNSIVIGDGDLTHKITLNNNEIGSSIEEKPLRILLDSKSFV